MFDGGNLGVEFAYGDPSVNVHPTDITDKKILDGRLRACDCGRRQSRPDDFGFTCLSAWFGGRAQVP